MFSCLASLSNSNFFFWFGLICFTRFLFVHLPACYNGFLLYVWACFAPSKNFVERYGAWAIVTGGSDGIGKHMAFELAAKGMNILVMSNVKNDLKAVSSEIEEKYGVKSKWLYVDFSDLSCYDAIKQCIDDIDDVGVLVNNVGMANVNFDTVAKEAESLIIKSCHVNAVSTALMTRIVLPKLMAKKKGLIVNMGSKAAVTTLPRGAMYCATKAFIRKLTECVNEEVQRCNVQITCIEPYIVRTALMLESPRTRAYANAMPLFVAPKADVFAKSLVRALNVRVPLFMSGYWSHAMGHYVLGFLLESDIGKSFKPKLTKAL